MDHNLNTSLAIGTYNVHGANEVTLSYINRVMPDFDILFVQEHWLHKSQMHLFEDHIDNVHVLGVSGMSDEQINVGRPFGGCAIIWRDSLSCAVKPIEVRNNRLCIVRLDHDLYSMLLINTYMPCDTSHDRANLTLFNDVLCEIRSVIIREDTDFVLMGGDLNTDMSRINSLHVDSLKDFCINENLNIVDSELVDYTYESKINNSKSQIDHFIISSSLITRVIKLQVKHDIENISDHSLLSIHLSIPKCITYDTLEVEDRLMWSKATANDIEMYKIRLDNELSKIQINYDSLYCNQKMCTHHLRYLNNLHDKIINSCLSSSECIPKKTSQCGDRQIPGWNQYVAPFKSEALFWHNLWKENGSPNSGLLYDIRRKTRAKYHYVLRQIMNSKKQVVAVKIAENYDNSNYKDFWNILRKLKGNSSKLPSCVDHVAGSSKIAELFKDKYYTLYNSVSYNNDELNKLKDDLDSRITSHYASETSSTCPSCSHSGQFVNVNDVVKALDKLKLGKHDGNLGHFSDHVIHGTRRLHVLLSLLFNSLLSHGYVPEQFFMSTVIPIPKNKKKSLNDSENYRAIALSSILGKIIDRIISDKCSYAFNTMDQQFGFKAQHSTNQCTFVVNEILQYYANNNTNCLITLIDASKAFDRVNYLKLFDLLLKRNICPFYARFLLNLYINQKLRVKWNSSVTDCCKVSNGVKQDGVLSPILFNVYMDELLSKLKNCGCGCYIGNVFVGALGYADDVTLLSPTVSGMNLMLDICEKFGEEYDVSFNPDKTKFIHVKCSEGNVRPRVMFMQKVLSPVRYDYHLGVPIGHVTNEERIRIAINDFAVRVNMVDSHFNLATPENLYFIFRQFCMPLYGSVLWDLSNKAVELFYVSWRKAIRKIMNLPRNTHCNLLNGICNDIPVKDQLLRRSLKFILSILESSNRLVYMCGQLAIQGSNSNVSNNITLLCNTLSIPRHNIKEKRNYNVKTKPLTDEIVLIRNILNDLHSSKFMATNNVLLDVNELTFVLNYLCTL